MADELQMIGDKELGEMIDRLTKDYGISTECLSNLLGVKVDEHEIEVPTVFEERCSFIDLILMLDTISKHEPDLRVKAFLEVLIKVHKISAATVAKFAKIPTDYVLEFISDSSTVPIEIKYKIASVVMVLRLIFNTVEPKI